MTDEVRAVQFDAEVRQIKTMADHSINLTLNVPEYAIEQMRVMLGWLQDQVNVLVERTDNHQ